MYDVISIGDCYEDIFLKPSKASILDNRAFSSGKAMCFGYGDKIPLESIDYHIGGSAANTAINFSKMGFSTAVISSVGNDSQGEKISQYLEDHLVDVSQFKKKNSSASNMSVILSYKGDRTIFTYHGEKDQSDYLINKSLKTKWIYLAPLGKETAKIENRIVEVIAKNGSGLIWNPGNYQVESKARNFRHLLNLCNIIILNKEEINRFVDAPGRLTLEDSMKKIHDYGARMVVVTDGGNGASCYDGQVFYKIRVTEDERVDATGAGNAFASSFSAKMILSNTEKPQAFSPSKEIIEQSLKWGVIVSGSVVSKIGAHEGLMSAEEIEEAEKKLVKLNAEIYAK